MYNPMRRTNMRLLNNVMFGQVQCTKTKNIVFSHKMQAKSKILLSYVRTHVMLIWQFSYSIESTFIHLSCAVIMKMRFHHILVCDVLVFLKLTRWQIRDLLMLPIAGMIELSWVENPNSCYNIIRALKKGRCLSTFFLTLYLDPF